MVKLKLKITKSSRVNPATKVKGFSGRVLTNGTADYDDIIEDAAEDTTFNQDEIRAAAGIFCRAAAKMLKQGYIVDLGPIGKLYPSCTSKWVEKADDLQLTDIKPSLYYRASEDVASAINGASLVWAKASDEGEVAPSSDTDNQNTTNSGTGGTDTTGTGDNGGTTPTNPDTPSDPGTGGGTGGGDNNGGGGSGDSDES